MRATGVLLLPAAALALALASCGTANPTVSSTPSAEQAITGFDGADAAVATSFRNINQTAVSNPGGLRQAALGHLRDSNTDVQYAAVYALALTVTSEQGSTEMVAMLTATNLDDRLLAAAAVTGIGNKQGLPVLIAALDQGGELSYRAPPQAAFDFARTELLHLTSHDFGLTSATDLAHVASTKSMWEAWWQTNQASVHFDQSIGKYAP